MAPTTIRLGTASPGNQPTKAETLAQLEHFAQRAAAKRIDILLLPEAYIGGYPRGTSFGCVIGGRTPEGREEYLRYFQNAVDLGDTVGDGAGAGEAWIKRQLSGDPLLAAGSSENDGIPNKRGDGTREQLERIARDTGVFLVTGLIEKAGGSLYCSVVYVCPKSGIVGKRRKVMPTGTERLVWAQGSPATLKAVSTVIRGVRINLAAAICWENYMPLVRQALYAQNINLYLAPTADGRDAWLSVMRTAAIEGRCFVVTSNMCTTTKSHASVINPSAALSSSSSALVSNNTFHEDDEDAADIPPITSPSGRRTSLVTPDGFEIALPKSASSAIPQHQEQQQQQQQPPQPRQRRTSVFDEDGNEIVLCRKPFQPPTTQHSPPRSPTTTFTSTSPTRTPPTATSTATGSPTHARKQQQQQQQAAVDTSTFTSRGGSAIISPYGDVLAGPQWEDDSGIICAEVDFDDCIRGRLDIDAAGHYSRNDSFKFSVEGLDLSPLPYH